MYRTLLISLRTNQQRYFSSSILLSSSQRQKSIIDKSKIPVLKEEDLEEQFIKGGGPGGSNVNKTVSCVCLKHIPTGIVVKCQFSRLLHQNREIARERMIERLDDHYNGEMSIKAQTERLLKEKSFETSRKSRRLNEIKARYKEHLISTGQKPSDAESSKDISLDPPQFIEK